LIIFYRRDECENDVRTLLDEVAAQSDALESTILFHDDESAQRDAYIEFAAGAGFVHAVTSKAFF
jgi:hypothetical protein